MAVFVPKFLKQLRDVVASAPADGDGLFYNDSTGKWESSAPAAGGATGAAGGVLGGTYPNPSFAADMATQAELDALAAVASAADASVAAAAAASLAAHLADTVDAHDASAISILDTGADFTATDVEGALAELQSDAETEAAARAAADSILSSAVAGKAAAVHVHAGEDITSGTVADARIASSIARDSEVTAAVAAEASARDTAIGVETSARTTADGLLTPKTRTLTAGTALTGGGDLSADRTFDVAVDGSTIEVSGDALRVKDGGITSAKIADGTIVVGDLAFDPSTQAELDAAIAALASVYQAKDTSLDYFAGLDPSVNVKAVLSAADYAAIRTLLGLVIGTNVQAYDADLTTYAGISPSANVQSVLGAADYAAIRTLLGLVIGTNVQAYDADLTTYASITPTAIAQTILAAANAAAVRTAIAAAASAQQVIAGSGLAGGGDLSADRTLDVNVDGSTIEINADTLRVKDSGITSAKIADGTIVDGDMNAAALASKHMFTLRYVVRR